MSQSPHSRSICENPCPNLLNVLAHPLLHQRCGMWCAVYTCGQTAAARLSCRQPPAVCGALEGTPCQAGCACLPHPHPPRPSNKQW
eukprot:1156377-Pelagomonas_calceolata.AAC.2